MTKKIAIIENEVVVNIIIDTLENAQAVYAEVAEVVGSVRIGDGFVNGSFVPQVDPPAPIPTTLRPYAMRMALLHFNLLDSVQQAVTLAGGQTLLAWEYALEFKRADPMVQGLAAQLQLSEAELDAIYTKGAEYL